MQILPFHVEHLKAMRLQPSQAHRAAELTDDVLQFIDGLEGYTAMSPAGEPLAVCGLMPFHPGRSMAWAFLSENAGPHMVGITRAVRRFLDMKAPRRCEMYVDAGFDAGCRWAELLGFQREGFLRAFDANGGDQIMFARIRNV